jgi:phage gp29-like protein
MARRRPPKTPKADTSPLVRNDNGDLQNQIAPWPQIDRWPILLGSNLTFAYIASAARICQQGYRYQFVDVLDELIEKDPHASAVFSQRILAVSGGACEITAVPLPKDHKDYERAEEIRKMVEERIRAIPRLQLALQILLWGIYYGITASEILWDRRPDGWWIAGLEMIHSRRLNYPDQAAWDLHIWDQGAVIPSTPGLFPTEGIYGLKVKDYPGKFLVFSPNYRGDYPTREGIGRIVAFFLAIKQMAVRGGAQYVERYAKPFAWACYNTKTPNNPNPRVANEQDILVADEALKAIGIGGLASATLPDSIEVKLDGPGIKGTTNGLNHERLIDLVDQQVSKAARGATLTTDVGSNGGNRALGQIHAEGDRRNARYDAAILAEALKSDVVWWLVHLNCPGEEHLCPGVTIHVEQVAPAEILDRADKASRLGAPIDAQWLADKIGQKLVDPEDPKARKLAPIKPVDMAALDSIEQQSASIADALQDLAANVGVSLTPAERSALSAMPREEAAELLRTILRSAKQPASSQPPPTTQAPKPPGAPAAEPDDEEPEADDKAEDSDAED